jgi:hypothetical protein
MKRRDFLAALGGGIAMAQITTTKLVPRVKRDIPTRTIGKTGRSQSHLSYPQLSMGSSKCDIGKLIIA